MIWRQKVLNRFISCSYAFILVIGEITVNAENDTRVTFKNCASFPTCKREINDVVIDEVNHIYLYYNTYNIYSIYILRTI